MAGNNLPATHDTFRMKWNVRAVFTKVQLPPLLCQRHNAALEFLHKSSFGPQSSLRLRPLPLIYITSISYQQLLMYVKNSFKLKSAHTKQIVFSANIYDLPVRCFTISTRKDLVEEFATSRRRFAASTAFSLLQYLVFVYWVVAWYTAANGVATVYTLNVYRFKFQLDQCEHT